MSLSDGLTVRSAEPHDPPGFGRSRRAILYLFETPYPPYSPVNAMRRERASAVEENAVRNGLSNERQCRPLHRMT
jgi:hypothetical protein